MFFANIPFFRVEMESAIKFFCHGMCGGAHFWRQHILKGLNGEALQKIQKFWWEILIKSIYEKSNTFQLLLNTNFRAFGDLLSCGSLGPPPPPPGEHHWTTALHCMNQYQTLCIMVSSWKVSAFICLLVKKLSCS